MATLCSTLLLLAALLSALAPGDALAMPSSPVSVARAHTPASKAKISADEAERIRRSKLVPFSRRYIMLRWTLGWMANVILFILMWGVVYVYGVTFGPLSTGSIVQAWFIGLGQTFLVVEPSEVLGLVLLPSIADNKCVVWWRTKMKDWGFI